VLDEAQRRLLRFRGGVASTLPLQIDGTIVDLSVAGDATIYVLESTGNGAATPALRSFTSTGTPLNSWFTAERTAAALRMGPDGPVELSYPSAEWMPAAAGGNALGQGAQARGGRAGRPLPDGSGDVVVYRLRDGEELRLASVGPNGVVHAWRILSGTSIAEVQLAQPLGDKLVAVFAVYTDDQSEFEVVVLDNGGIVREFTVPTAEWAESAPLGRFRLVGSSLYQLGSTSSGVFVDRFDLGVR